ncbi:hypothetical protein [Absidia glauca]|uniref:Uncharacterized protein n=1 Tax=Absidia glauca TaxID=4829 RepID=A0A163M1L8_ABSGL|nr:hypothetical protein [Absidia glauca]
MLTNQESVIETTAQANKAPRSPPKELAGFTGDVLDHLGSSEDRFSFKVRTQDATTLLQILRRSPPPPWLLEFGQTVSIKDWWF